VTTWDADRGDGRKGKEVTKGGRREIGALKDKGK